jgi:hypothetical protein
MIRKSIKKAVFRPSLLIKYSPLLFMIIAALYADYSTNRIMFQNRHGYIYLLQVSIILYSFYSIFFNKIVISEDRFIIHFPLLTTWRTKRILIETIKEITLKSSPFMPSMIVVTKTGDKVKTYEYSMIIFTEKTKRQLLDHLKTHPLNRAEILSLE